MAEYDAGTGPSIDIGESVEASDSPVERWNDSGFLWGMGYQEPVIEDPVPFREWPLFERSIP